MAAVSFSFGRVIGVSLPCQVELVRRYKRTISPIIQFPPSRASTGIPVRATLRHSKRRHVMTTTAHRPTIAVTRHAIAAGHYLASTARFDILQAGGNAI